MIDNPRLRLVLARHGRAIAIALAVIGALALVASGWAVANPSTATTSQYADERVSSDVETSAVVVQDGTLWNEGDRLENSRVYMLNESPELTVEPSTSLVNETAGAPIDDGEVSHELALRYEATREGETFWEETHALVDESPTLEDGVATSETTIDVADYRERQQELERELSGVGDVDLYLELDVEYDTGTAQGSQELSTTLQVTNDAYWLGEHPSTAADHTHLIGTEETTEPRNVAMIAALSLLGTGALVAAVAVGRRAPIDEEAARRAVHEQRYAEWISRGSIPMWIGDYHVSLDSLEDVVDVAIDANERVVNDRQRGLFAVVSDGVVYYYSDRGLWEETAWPEMDLEAPSSVVDADEPAPSEALELEDGDRSADADDGFEFTEADGEFGDPDDEGFDDDEDVWKKL